MGLNRYNRIQENRTVKLLSITIDNERKFRKHLCNVCLKANRKLYGLMRIRKYLDLKKIRKKERDFLKPNSNTAPLGGCFIVNVQIKD